MGAGPLVIPVSGSLRPEELGDARTVSLLMATEMLDRRFLDLFSYAVDQTPVGICNHLVDCVNHALEESSASIEIYALSLIIQIRLAKIEFFVGILGRTFVRGQAGKLCAPGLQGYIISDRGAAYGTRAVPAGSRLSGCIVQRGARCDWRPAATMGARGGDSAIPRDSQLVPTSPRLVARWQQSPCYMYMSFPVVITPGATRRNTFCTCIKCEVSHEYRACNKDRSTPHWNQRIWIGRWVIVTQYPRCRLQRFMNCLSHAHHVAIFRTTAETLSVRIYVLFFHINSPFLSMNFSVDELFCRWTPVVFSPAGAHAIGAAAGGDKVPAEDVARRPRSPAIQDLLRHVQDRPQVPRLEVQDLPAHADPAVLGRAWDAGLREESGLARGALHPPPVPHQAVQHVPAMAAPAAPQERPAAGVASGTHTTGNGCTMSG